MSDEEPTVTADVTVRLAEALRKVAHWCQHNPCTTCLIVSDEQLDATIFATAMTGDVATQVEGSPEAIADALLPVVRAIVADELRAAAADFAREDNGPGGALVALSLHVRADRLAEQ